MSRLNDFRMMMMMVTKVRTGFEVVQLHSCDEDLLAVLHACALRRIIIAEKAGNKPTHRASTTSHQQRSAEQRRGRR